MFCARWSRRDVGKEDSVVEGNSTDFVWLENQREGRLVRQRDYMLSFGSLNYNCIASCITDRQSWACYLTKVIYYILLVTF